MPIKATPNTLSTCTLLHTTIIGTAHRSGRADRVAMARSTSHRQMAMPANENTCGRGIARGSIVTHTIAETITAAAQVERCSTAMKQKTSASAINSACAVCKAAALPIYHSP